MRQSKRAIGSDLRKVDLHVIAPHEYEEAPELTDEQLANAVFSVGSKPRDGPPSERPKQEVKLRLDTDVLSAYRAIGEGWEARINSDLRRAASSTRRNTKRGGNCGEIILGNESAELDSGVNFDQGKIGFEGR
jgi:uncharacterized protein (DUF4415 family)